MQKITCAIALSLAIGLTGCTRDDNKTEKAKTAVKAEATKPAEAANSAQANDTMARKLPTSPPKMAIPKITAEDQARFDQTVASSFGKGSFKNDAGITYSFTLEGSMLKDNSSFGHFRFYSFQGDGKLDVKGEMHCVYIDSAERRIWMAGKITDNSSTVTEFKQGVYAPGGYVSFRATPNAISGTEMKRGAIEVPSFVDQPTADKFCKDKIWTDAKLIKLGENDLIAAIP